MSNYLEQESLIWRICLRGKEEDLKKLDQAYEDPELDPEVRKIIHRVRQKLSAYTQRGGAETLPSSHE